MGKIQLPGEITAGVVSVNFVDTVAGWDVGRLSPDLRTELDRLKGAKGDSYDDFLSYDRFMVGLIRSGAVDLYVVEGAEDFPARFKQSSDSELALYSNCSEERIELILDKLGLGTDNIDAVLGTENRDLFPETGGKDFASLRQRFDGEVIYVTHKPGEVSAAHGIIPTVYVGDKTEVESTLQVATLNEILEYAA